MPRWPEKAPTKRDKWRHSQLICCIQILRLRVKTELSGLSRLINVALQLGYEKRRSGALSRIMSPHGLSRQHVPLSLRFPHLPLYTTSHVQPPSPTSRSRMPPTTRSCLLLHTPYNGLRNIYKKCKDRTRDFLILRLPAIRCVTLSLSLSLLSGAAVRSSTEDLEDGAYHAEYVENDSTFALGYVPNCS